MEEDLFEGHFLDVNFETEIQNEAKIFKFGCNVGVSFLKQN